MASPAMRAALIMRSIPLAGCWKHTSRMLSTSSIISHSNNLYLHHTCSSYEHRHSARESRPLGSLMNISAVRYNSTEGKVAETRHQTIEEAGDMLVIKAKPISEMTKSEAIWTSLEDAAMNAPIKSAIIPFTHLNFFQIAVFPYTYAVMYYLDLMLTFLPWWQAIIVTTATARIIFFPLVLKQNIVGIKTANIMPESQKIQMKINEALVAGDSYNSALNKTKLQILYKEHGLTMKDRLVPLLIQAPMYASLFFLLRTLTGVPVDGLSTGGALWFTDLTVPDPYYILPIVTSGSLFMLFEFGMEGAVNPSQGMGPIGRYVMRAMPFGLFLFIQGFPAATLLFWCTSNLFTLGYALFFKNQWVKKKLNIPARIIHSQEVLPVANQTFKGQVKSAIEKGKVKRTSMDVRRLDDMAFKKAGVGPLRKTYKEPPTGA